jgi:hypothetical protein
MGPPGAQAMMDRPADFVTLPGGKALGPNGLSALYLLRPVLLGAPTGAGLPGSIALCVAGLMIGVVAVLKLLLTL